MTENGTQFASVYNRFLEKVTDDMYIELTIQDTIKDLQNWSSKRTKVKGETLLKIMNTMRTKYNIRFMIVPKKNMGKMIMKLLGVKE